MKYFVKYIEHSKKGCIKKRRTGFLDAFSGDIEVTWRSFQESGANEGFTLELTDLTPLPVASTKGEVNV